MANRDKLTTTNRNLIKIGFKICRHKNCKQKGLPQSLDRFYRCKKALGGRMNNCKECHKNDANTGWNPRNNGKREKDENGRLVYDAKRYEPGGYFYEKEKRKQRQWEKLLDGLSTDFEEFKKIKNPKEKDYRNFIAAYIKKNLNLKVIKEKPLDKENRPDLTLPNNNIIIEVKLNAEKSHGRKKDETCAQQMERYQAVAGRKWKVYLVSLDGSIGMAFEELIENINNSLRHCDTSRT